MNTLLSRYRVRERYILYSGGGLIIGALLLLLIIYYPILWEELHYQFVTKQNYSSHGAQTRIVVGNHQRDATAENALKKNGIYIPRDSAFNIIIPKIDANAPVIKDVDPYDEQSYRRALQRGIAHAEGTSVPSLPGNTFLFAHSSDHFYNRGRYNAVFYLLNKLTPGDAFFIVYKQRVYKYIITRTRVVSYDAVDYLTSKGDTQTATLMTCWPPGTDAHRLLVEGTLYDTTAL